MNTYPESGKQLIEQAGSLLNNGDMLEARALLDGALLEYGFLPPEAESLRSETLDDSEEIPVASVGPRPGKGAAGRECPLCGEAMVEHEVVYDRLWHLCPACALLTVKLDHDLAKRLDNGEAGGAKQPAGALVHRREYTFCRRFAEGFGADAILNYGVGWSMVPEALRGDGFDAVGCDLWRPLVEQRRKEFGPESFYHRDELPDRRFPIISAFEVFEHFTDPRKDVAVLVDHLADSGMIIGSTDFWHGGILADHPSQFKTYWKHLTHVVAWTWQSMRVLADHFGLQATFFRGDFADHSSKCFFALHRGEEAARFLSGLPKILPDVYGMQPQGEDDAS
ncbi:methyltransferase domain-containing protein [uncultured Pseudodesulfovibrio sp.]|uniref:class I SAM-dependent methyltransferase n=1 Tax=uncultured Pseudodesulfovibrio sp. TaxID=2035858 RepID=UPI0029C6BD0D|nr:methyltransferase domain-containing protein [uncultured Pseudodesulfovibrio sp.]